MTPASARSLRRKRVAELRQAEPGLSLRQMAGRLGLSRDTVRRDLDDLAQQTAESATPADGATAAAESAPGGAGMVSQTAPQVNAGGVADSATAAEASSSPVAHGAPLPQRLTGPLELPDGYNLHQWRAVRRDLAVLAPSGMSAEAIVHLAVSALAADYTKALAAGDIEPGQPIFIDRMVLRPRAVVGPRTRQGD